MTTTTTPDNPAKSGIDVGGNSDGLFSSNADSQSQVSTDHFDGRIRSLIRLIPILRSERGRFIITILCHLGAQAGAIAAATLAAWMVGLVASGRPATDLVLPAVSLGFAVIIRGACVWLEMWWCHDLAYRIMAVLRVNVFDGLDRIAPAWLLGKRTGDVGSAAMNDVESLEWFYAHAIAQFGVCVTVPLGGVAALAVIDPRLALILLPFALAIMTVPFWLIRLADRQGKELRSQLGLLHADVVDGVQGLRELTFFGRTDSYFKKLRSRSQALMDAQRSHGWRGGVEAGVSDFIVAAAMISVLAYCAVLVGRGELDRAVYPPAVILTAATLTPITEIVGGIRNLGVLRATASRVFNIVDADAHVADPVEPETLICDSAPEVSFENVSFGYDETQVLHDVTFTIEAGQTVALVGHSGAGKSTCANLLMRFWDTDSGSISIDGVDISAVTQHQLRDVVGLVPQDGYLFNTSIMENIRLMDTDYDEVAVTRAAQDALVTEFSDRLDGLDTVIGERGAQLSGGQRQRVAIARALLRDTPVLIMDEAVSNIDTEGEAVLHESFKRIRGGRSTLVIAHRLSTILTADKVVMLAGGKVSAIGTHEELVSSSQEYRDLLSNQIV